MKFRRPVTPQQSVFEMGPNASSDFITKVFVTNTQRVGHVWLFMAEGIVNHNYIEMAVVIYSVFFLIKIVFVCVRFSSRRHS